MLVGTINFGLNQRETDGVDEFEPKVVTRRSGGVSVREGIC